ncbi:hypothetical protein RI367_008085 [Sorochytrium milnesiophthora]
MSRLLGLCTRSVSALQSSASAFSTASVRFSRASHRGGAGIDQTLSTRSARSFAVHSDAPRSSSTVVSVDLGGPEKDSSHSIWLRDHCRCEKCFHPITKQRLVNTLAIPSDIHPTEVLDSGAAVQLRWPDNHVSVFDKAWLKKHAYWPVLRSDALEKPAQKTLWDASIINKLPTVNFTEVMGSDAGLGKWLDNIDVYGFSLVQGVPANTEDTKKLAERIAFIRPTHYGGFWDFTPNLEHGDTAYTSIALGAHTDTTYFSDPVGLQMFHLLEFNGTGGQSLFVDGFAVARQLKEKSPSAYRALTEIPLATHSAGDQSTYVYPHPRYHPLLNVDERTGELYQIRYNNDDRSVLNHLRPSEVDAFYRALREWQALVTDKKNELWLALKPGTAVIFDNWRILHGRAAFTGHRRLTGCYINGDDWRSRLRTVNRHPKEMF